MIMDDNSILDLYFTHKKKKYKYIIYDYYNLNEAKLILYNKLVCRLSSHDKLLYNPISGFETFHLSDGSTIRFTEGLATVFETTEGYRTFLFLAKCIKYALEKSGRQETLAKEDCSYIIVERDLAEILLICSEYEKINEWDTHFTIDGMYVVSKTRENFLVFHTKEEMQLYIKLNSMKEE